MLSACGDSNNNEKRGGVSQHKLKIVTSIKPVQAMVLAIAEDTVDAEQLIPDYASPHDYSFKPSDIRKVKGADLIFRIDEHMETQLNGIFGDHHNNNTSIISLAEVNGLTLLQANDQHQTQHDTKHKKHDHNDQHKDHEKGHGSKNSHDHKHHNHHSHHNNIDFHLWTSPKNTVLMANKISQSLTKLDPKNADYYQQNINKFFEEVKTESEKITLKLAPFKDQPYIVFHNSWQYFAAEFGLQKPIVINLHEGVSSGAKTISDVRQRIEKDKIGCVFYDSSVSLARLNVITKKAKTVEIDVLARNITLDQSSYIRWLEQLGNQIESCFSI